ncbi:MAG: mechanosensitive ion channel family protein [Candidatus Palauibacterales bacterium]|nr:mechanosensitive ion channel family protein [Candidatus Palauibacterales bacterium]MDP2482334.1 mechanosensitive ion channel family protein [Candidatus Palauibacterales bacterium]
MDVLRQVVFGNEVGAWLIAIGVGFGTAGALRILLPAAIRRVGRLAKDTRNQIDDAIVAAAGATRGFFYLVAGAYVGLRFIEAPAAIEGILNEVVATAVLLQMAIWGVCGFRALLDGMRHERYADDPEVATSFHLIRVVGTAAIWFLALLFVLQAWGINVTALVTGLGITGIAVALAVQSILADLFASLSIIFDKPFLVGDFLAIDDYLGAVEKIGLKTTQLRSMSGEQLVFSNSDLLKSRIRNYGRMAHRRVAFGFGIVYETNPDLVARIPTWVREIIETEEVTRFDRCHFKRLGDWALEFETVYFVVVPDYAVFMDVQQRVNLALMRRLGEAGVDFAYPTQLQYERRLDAPPAERGSDGVRSSAVDASGDQV